MKRARAGAGSRSRSREPVELVGAQSSTVLRLASDQAERDEGIKRRQAIESSRFLETWAAAHLAAGSHRARHVDRLNAAHRSLVGALDPPVPRSVDPTRILRYPAAPFDPSRTGPMQPLRARDSTSRTRQSDPRIQHAKGLGLELKNLLKTREPSDRQVEHQRDATRKAYLAIVYSAPALTASSLALLSSSRSSSSLASHPTALEALNLLWLETTHILITIYRSKLAKMDKYIAENPKPPPARTRDRRGGNDGDIQPAHPPAASVVGPVARRKLLHQFQKFLHGEQEFWKIIVNRLASRLTSTEQVELRPLGIIATAYDDTNVHSQPDESVQVSPEELGHRRLQVLPLAHRGLIFYGDLARYIEFNSDLPSPAAASGRGKGGKKGNGKAASGPAAIAPPKTYAKAAECYRQANLLMPDDGNAHNQLAVLAQYALDPVTSAYHYYRALAVRFPFPTAFKNLSIAYSKCLQRYDFGASRGSKAGTDKVQQFRESFIALHAVFFTKTKLTELTALSAKVDRLFEHCTRERLITSDGVLKIAVTALAALWHARITRSKTLNDTSTIQLSRSKSTSLPSTTEATAREENGPKLEAHILLHTLELYTTLLSISSAETNELYVVNSTDSTTEEDGQIPPLISNISAVLRRSIPSLRILGRWLKGQLEYIERLEKRVADKEKKHLRQHRTSGASSAEKETLEDAQRPAESSGEGNPSEHGIQIVTSDQLQRTLDRFWQAFADYSNSIKLAFPNPRGSDEGGLPILEEGVWLEEDVECLGFLPLRKRTGTKEGSNSRDAARRVGRDVHPNQEVLMRVEEAQRLAEEIVESPISRLALVDGAFIFVAKGDKPVTTEQDADVSRADGNDQAMATVEVEQDDDALDEDFEMPDQSIEDDPVDRAMRTAADQLELDGDGEDEQDDDDDDEEQIVFSGSRNLSHPALPVAASPRQGSFSSRGPVATSTLTAADLRQQLFASNLPLQPLPAAAPPRTPSHPLSSGYVSPPLVAPAAATTSPSSETLSRIWGMPSPTPPSHLGHAPSHVATASVLPPHQPMTRHSFEAIPNLTHDAFAAQNQGWSNPLATSGHLPPPPHSSAQPPSIPPAELFGGHPAFALPHSHSHPQPTSLVEDSRSYSLPPLTSSFPGYTRQPSTSSFSPAAPAQFSPGLSTAQVGLMPNPGFFNRTTTTTTNSGSGFALPPPGESGGNWPTHLGGGAGRQTG
ncbi:uncharacterized protein JCM15063_004945 [Sporobolomyces koalae]|uniref:uncharacterized protein n=1 Tax=Sporobolomyces koalae TaxID=500713 RepID=UPI003176B372